MKNKKKAQVFHFDLYGKREDKYDFLNSNSVKSISWNELDCKELYYFFVPKKLEYDVYNEWFQIDKIFQKSNSGVQTGKDEIVISDNKNTLFNTIHDILTSEHIEQIRKKHSLIDTSGWSLKNFRKTTLDKQFIQKIDYKPFDTKYIYFEDNALKRSRKSIIKHILHQDNYAFISMRQYSYEIPYYCYSLITKNMVPDRFFMSYKGTPYIFPLYLYPEITDEIDINQNTRKPNLNMAIVNQIAEKLALRFTSEKEQTEGTLDPIDILDYIYAVLHSPTYREKYKEFLKIDFPRVPYPKDAKTFWQLVKLGGELRRIHLLESPIVEKRITTYPQAGDNIVIKPRFENHKVWINDEQYFDNVPEIAWEFYIGGYQPAQKWLKDRKGRKLNFDDILHYQKIIAALSETDTIMKNIDDIDFM